MKKVQHPTGGVIGEILVREGSRGPGGRILVRLDGTQIRTNLDIVLNALDELAAAGRGTRPSATGRRRSSSPTTSSPAPAATPPSPT